MTQTGRDPEYPSVLWVPEESCPHPEENVSLRAMKVLSPDEALVDVFCFKCGSHWTDFKDMPTRIYNIVYQRFWDGQWRSSDPELEDKMRYNLAALRSQVLDSENGHQ